MIRIAPFRPLRYNPEKISFISRVVAPPYDIVDDAYAERLRERDAHNVIRLVLGKTPPEGRPEEEYAEAARTLRQWRGQGVLVRDDTPAVYICEQEFALGDDTVVRRGLICAMLLEEFSTGRVMPHERTMAGPKADRLHLMQACRANLSLVFGVVSDAEGEVDGGLASLTSGEPLYEFGLPEGVVYRQWRVDDRDAIAALASQLRQETLVIADGHHRYETALRYRAENRDPDLAPGLAPEDFLPIFAVSVRNPGLRILPTHRLVRAPEGMDPAAVLNELGAMFSIEEFAADGPGQFIELAARIAMAPDSIGYYTGAGLFYVLRPKDKDPLAQQFPDLLPEWRQLPVTILHHAVLARLFGIPVDGEVPPDDLQYAQDAEQLYWRVASGSFDAAFLLPPTRPDIVEAVARAGARMPPKSTFYYPKIATGLALYPFEGGGFVPVPPSAQ